ncbi:hypothetical protein [Roseomonas indoligenes]|uniref:Uncharacterized protein n=1 Tax=Roseomonas indoligenes TaxID=2820811 RepID=A0A940MZ43_9PROT|nr:hypothetical protein [Pararoseomonas indoligenes]MBP0496024.1 hypothetical protein [Pararoseomonas indoligenes]
MTTSTPTLPAVGILWFVALARRMHLLTRAVPLDQAEPYDDALTLPDGHYETWQAWSRRTLPLPDPALRPLITMTEYDSWPRGRVVYQRTPDRFVVYADRQLLGPTRLTRIYAAFGLTPDRTIARTDPHYRYATRLPADEG